jgi:acetylornithine/succinyldiaminopimelate/putrescine aminotransferase
MTLAKALGGGLPLGAMLAREAVARSFSAGSHASTFGGNPLVCSVGTAVLRSLLQGGVLKNCAKMGKLLMKGLVSLKARLPVIRDVRGVGLIVGVELECEGDKIVEECMQQGLLVNCTAHKVLRFLPPLIINKKDIDQALAILERVLSRR